MKKGILSFMLVVSILSNLIVALPITVKAEVESFQCGENLIYTLDEDGILTISGNGSMWSRAFIRDDRIHTVIIENGVTEISDEAFSRCYNMTSITISDSVMSIGSEAFSRCENLENVVLPNSIKSIGERAFYNCSRLTEITLPKGLTVIESDTFAMCDNLQNVVIPNSVTTIRKKAFRDCLSLCNITIPESVFLIEAGAFYECGELKITVDKSNKNYSSDENGVLFNKEKSRLVACHFFSLFSDEYEIPYSVKIVGSYAFSGCDFFKIKIPGTVEKIERSAFERAYITKITVDESNLNYSSDKSGVLFNKDKSKLVAFPRKLDDTYTIPDGVSVIGDGAFSGCSSLLEVKIPSGVTSIGNYAFVGCRDLTSITIPDGVTKIGDAAFMECYELKSIEIPNGIKVIGDETFFGCYNLESVKIPAGVISIGDYAFAECECLSEVNIPANVTNIGKGAFSDCSFSAIKIPDKVTVIRDETFFGCYNLESVKIPAGVISIGDYAFSDCSFTELKIPAGVINIGEGAFDSCPYLKRIEIPDGVTKIGEAAFLFCEELKSIEIPDGVKEIGEDTFAGCWNLTDVTIPSSVTSIGNDAFIECDSLADVYYGGNEESWKKISVGKDNENLTSAKIHYINQKDIVLSATQINATPDTCQSIFVYKADGVTPYDKGVKVTSSNKCVVKTSRKGNEIILTCNAIGTSSIIVSTTDGSGSYKICDVVVNDKVTAQERYILERFALDQIVYSKNLETGKKIKEQSANKSWKMFYFGYNQFAAWGDFYENYIGDYTVIMRPEDVFPEGPKDGFYAAAFESPKGDIVIAYRGSEGAGISGIFKFMQDEDELKENVDWWGTNLDMFTGNGLSSQFSQALDFYDCVKHNNEGKEITLTGHSLGGALASYTSINKGVRCDNVNGATGWLFNNEIFCDPDNYPVNFVGFDQTVFEHFCGQMDLTNKPVTRWANLNTFNYKMYKASDNYNIMKTQELVAGDKVDVPGKDYHKISSIINYNYGQFAPTSQTKTFNMKNEFVNVGTYDYIGTSKGEKIIKNALTRVRFPGSVLSYKVPASCFAVGGGGNDSISFTSGGDDILIGNSGNDVLNGGAGNDTYVFGGQFGNDIIMDPSGADKIIFTDISFDDLIISGANITFGSNSVRLSSDSKRREKITVVDMNNDAKFMAFQNASVFSLKEFIAADTTKGIEVFGNATVEIYDASEEVIETLTINEETEENIEYKDYGMVALSPQSLGLTLHPDGYIIKIKSDEIVEVWSVSDADNQTLIKQTYVERDLSNGSVIAINTGEMVEEQLSVKFMSDATEEIIYSEAPDNLYITADKTEIKTGESITLSVTEEFEEAVTWKCINDNAIISVNDDKTISVIGVNSGEETVRAYLPNDELYSAEISFKIIQDLEPNVVVKYQDTAYDGETIATDSVFFDVTMAEEYDTIVFDTFSPYSQIEDTNTFVVNGVGDHFIKVYCENSVTGARTKAFTFEFSQDSEAPEIAGVENEAVYYTDRVIEVSDTALDTIYINGELCEEESFIISEVGSYTIIATDMAGNTTSISFELRDMLSASKLSLSDAETVSQIRNDFEEVKYSLSEERMNVLETEISNLEEAINRLYAEARMAIFIDEKYDSNVLINLSIANAPEDATIYIAAYDSLGALLELKEPELKDGIAKETFSLTNVFKYVAFVWNSNLVPLTKTKECYLR